METSLLFYWEGLQNLGLCSTSTVFEKKRVFIVSHGASDVAVSSEGLPRFIKRTLRTYSNRTGQDPSEIIYGIKGIRLID